MCSKNETRQIDVDIYFVVVCAMDYVGIRCFILALHAFRTLVGSYR